MVKISVIVVSINLDIVVASLFASKLLRIPRGDNYHIILGICIDLCGVIKGGGFSLATAKQSNAKQCKGKQSKTKQSDANQSNEVHSRAKPIKSMRHILCL